MTAGSSGMEKRVRVVALDHRADDRVERFLATHRDGLVFHHPAWLIALEDEYKAPATLLAALDEDGGVQGVLPLLPTRGLPLRLGDALFGRRLSSLPRTPVAGPLASSPAVSAALVGEAVERVRREPGTVLQLKVWSSTLDGLVDGVVGTPWRPSFTLDLPDRPEDLRFGQSRNHSRVMWAVRKAAREGIEVREADTEPDLRAWYRLYLETMRQGGMLVRPYRFFATIWRLMRPRGLMRLLLAEQRAAGERHILAGAVFLMFGGTVFYAFSGRRLDGPSARPNELLQWHAIRDACAAGYRRYDLGEAPRSHDGMTGFKSKWVSEPTMLHRYYYPEAPRSTEPSLETGSRVRRGGLAAWRRLPLGVTSRVSDRLYAYL